VTQAPSHDFHSVVLCGDSGSRLWPLSREQLPQPFTTGDDGSSVLQQTLLTLRAIGALTHATLVCGEAYRFVASDQMEEMGMFNARLVLEPCGRGTAPAVTAAALLAVRRNMDPVLLVCPADLGIDAEAALIPALAAAHRAAMAGRIVVFGMTRNQPVPRRPVFRVPNDAVDNAPTSFLPMLRYLDVDGIERVPADDERDLWHSGVLIAKASVWLAELSRHAPEVLDTARLAVEDGSEADLVFKLELMNYARSPAATIETMVLPRTQLGAVVPLDAAWIATGLRMQAKGSDGSDRPSDLVTDSQGSVVYTTRPNTDTDNGDLILMSGAHRMNDGDADLSTDPRASAYRPQTALPKAIDAFSDA
jgi:mannose-1-phosphate guanylyltransferase/mannose-6-phosphate isomerase